MSTPNPYSPMPAASLGGAERVDAGHAGTTDAGFWRRFAAYLIDSLIVTCALVVLMLGAGTLLPPGAGVMDALPLAYLPAMWLYFALQESSARQATLGKRALGILVVGPDGGPIGFGRACGRHFAAALSYASLYIGYMLAGWTRRKQGLHDLIAGTFVITRVPGSPMPVWSVVLVVGLGFALPMLGILAAIAIPAYQDYTSRAHVAQAMAESSPLKIAYAEHVADSGAPPDAAALAGFAPIQSERARIAFERGLLLIRFSDAAAGGLGGKQVALEPIIDAASGFEVRWLCGQQAPPAHSEWRRPAELGAADATTVRAAMLPASCRY